MSEFMGKNGFQWFVGVVEDRQDPQTLGRLRVRCLGYHTDDLVKLPTHVFVASNHRSQRAGQD